jgi:hypothetical protein|uniref:Uncharacterized protein n=1 Tax=Siphoviridae sp. ctq1q8 TaxID=2826467 RepID=A0A8S5MFT5_9CAUD|nr:MAG TPA: hypothetical protein [Siphoviridae sp. ctq1q8]
MLFILKRIRWLGCVLLGGRNGVGIKHIELRRMEDEI